MNPIANLTIVVNGNTETHKIGNFTLMLGNTPPSYVASVFEEGELKPHDVSWEISQVTDLTIQPL